MSSLVDEREMTHIPSDTEHLSRNGDPMPITPETVDAVLSELASERERADNQPTDLMYVGATEFARLYDALRACLDALEDRSTSPDIPDGGSDRSTGTLDGRDEGSGPATDRHRVELRDRRNEDMEIRGVLSPADGPRAVPAEISMRGSLVPAIRWLVDRVAELAPRVIDNPEDLDALPPRSVVIDGCEDEVLRRTREGMWREFGSDIVCSSQGVWLPATVLWQPAPPAEPTVHIDGPVSFGDDGFTVNA